MRETGRQAAAEDDPQACRNLREDVMRLAGQVSALVSATGDKALGDVEQRIAKWGTLSPTSAGAVRTSRLT